MVSERANTCTRERCSYPDLPVSTLVACQCFAPSRLLFLIMIRISNVVSFAGHDVPSVYLKDQMKKSMSKSKRAKQSIRT